MSDAIQDPEPGEPSSDRTAPTGDGPSEPKAGEGPPRFGASTRALAQRRLLALALALIALACLALLWKPSDGAAAASWGVRAVLTALLAAVFFTAARQGLSKALAEREVLIHEHALELRRGGFRRLVVFENLRHIRTEQSPSGRLWSLRLDLEDDSVTLRDVEGLARVFTETAQRRPSGTLIEAHETRVDWGEPLPWLLLILGLGLAAAAGAWWAGAL